MKFTPRNTSPFVMRLKSVGYEVLTTTLGFVGLIMLAVLFGG
jgi:hypothetical protein